MKRLLLTGGAGFVGRHMLRYLLDHTDYEIVVLDRLDSAAMGWELADLLKASVRCKWIFHDLKSAFSDVLSEKIGPVDFVIHLAAASHVTRSVQDPIGFLQDNVLGTANLFEWIRQKPHSQIRTLCFSTDEVYGAASIPMPPNGQLYPTNPYAASKAGAELLGPAYANTYGMDIVVTRCTNIYGPGQHEEKFIPLARRAILEDRVLQIHSLPDGTVSSRRYLYVEDVCAATLMVLQRGGYLAGQGTGIYNIGNDSAYDNRLVAERIAQILGRRLRFDLVFNPPNRPKPDMCYAVDDSMLRALGWCPKVTLDEGLRRTILPDEKSDTLPAPNHHGV